MLQIEKILASVNVTLLENAIKNTCDGLEFHYIHKQDRTRERNVDAILSHHAFSRLREKQMYYIKEVKENKQLSLF